MASENEQTKSKWRHPIRAALGSIGIRRHQEKGKWLVLTRRFRLIVLVGIIGLVSVFCWFTFYYSNQPSFCGSCHFMEPYVQSWRESPHSDVKCYKCHIPAGWKGLVKAKAGGVVQLIKDLTGDYGTMPQAEIEDAACLQEGCHETSLLDGNVMFKGKYIFDHTPHLTKLRGGKKLRCTSCHSQIVHDTHMSVPESVCFTCHFKGKVHGRDVDAIGGCTSCHLAPDKPIKTQLGMTFDHKPLLDRKVACANCHFDTVQGTGVVPRQVCETCHGEAEKLEKYSDPELIHDWHVTRRKVECFQCHGEIRHGLHPEPLVRQRTSCEACHSDGHTVHSDMFAGKGGRGVEGKPSMHFLANVDCVGCHEISSTENGGRHVDVSSRLVTERACLKCHGKTKEGALVEWKELLGEQSVEADKALAKAVGAFDALAKDDPRRAKAKDVLDLARFNRDFVQAAFGLHNPDYAIALLEKSAEDAAKALRIINGPIAPAEKDK